MKNRKIYLLRGLLVLLAAALVLRCTVQKRAGRISVLT